MNTKMNQQSCLLDFSRYSILSVLGMLGVSCYILADTFFIAKGMGTDGLTALNLAIPVYNFIHGTGLMIGMGGATKFSVCKSQGWKKEVNQIFTHTIYLGILFSSAFALAGFFFSQKLALFLGANADVLQMTDTYLRWLLLFAPAFIFNDIFLCFVRNDENPQLSMAAMMTGSFANILLDYIFIFPMHLGIFGAILATGLSPIISIILMLSHWLGRKNTFHLIKTKIKTTIGIHVLSLGFPSLIAQLSSGIVMMTFNAIILGIEGNTGVAAYGVIANISLVIVAIFTGIAQGVQPLVSSFYGKRQHQQIKKIFRYSMITMLAVSFLEYFIIFILAQPITSVFNSENNFQLQQIAVAGLKLYFISSPFAGYNIILAIFFTSIEKALPAHILSLLRGLILIIPLALILSAAFTMTGVWLAYPITELLVAILGFIIYRLSSGKI